MNKQLVYGISENTKYTKINNRYKITGH